MFSQSKANLYLSETKAPNKVKPNKGQYVLLILVLSV